MIRKFVVAVIAILGILPGLLFSIFYHIYNLNENDEWSKNAYYIFGGINTAITYMVLLASIINQRHQFHDNNTVDTMQSFTTNVIIVFMVSLYFSVLSTLGLIGSFSTANNTIQFFYNGGVVIGIFMIAAHFVGGLKWGLISKNNSYDKFSANWWCCLYLVIKFALYMEETAVQPWISHTFFVEINHDIEERTGQFVSVLIMYGCRPALTILLFRCIEQIIHQMSHHHHGDHHDNDHDYTPPDYHGGQNKSIQITSDDYQKLPNNDDDDRRRVSIKDNGTKISFPHSTATESMAFFVFILFVMVWDIMSLGQDDYSMGYTFDFLGWSIVYGLQTIWSFYVFIRIKKEKLNVITIRNVLTTHLSLFISASGLILANIGQIGVHSGIWQVILSDVGDIIYIIIICMTLVILNEAKIKQNEFLKNMKFKWLITSFGKIVIVVHAMLIVHDFLSEAFHLEHTLHAEAEEYQETQTIVGAMEFILFFWGIEFHLACIERIEFHSTTTSYTELNII